MLGPVELTCEVFQGRRVAEYILQVGGKGYSYRGADFGSCTFLIVCLPETQCSDSMRMQHDFASIYLI